MALTDNQNVFASKVKSPTRGKSVSRANTSQGRFETEPVLELKNLNTRNTETEASLKYGASKYAVEAISDFEITRNGKIYKVNVKQRQDKLNKL